MDRCPPARIALSHTQHGVSMRWPQSIVYQQLSGAAAATIFGRVRAIYAPKKFPHPGELAATPRHDCAPPACRMRRRRR